MAGMLSEVTLIPHVLIAEWRTGTKSGKVGYITGQLASY